jgi:hypothetical protein
MPEGKSCPDEQTGELRHQESRKDKQIPFPAPETPPPPDTPGATGTTKTGRARRRAREEGDHRAGAQTEGGGTKRRAGRRTMTRAAGTGATAGRKRTGTQRAARGATRDAERSSTTRAVRDSSKRRGIVKAETAERERRVMLREQCEAGGLTRRCTASRPGGGFCLS